MFKPYTDAEKVALAKKYTPAQLRAIEAGEKAVRPEDIDRRGILRSDAGALRYLDDLSTLRTLVDKKQQFDRPMDPNYRMMNEEELGAGYDKAMERILEGYVAPDRDDPDYHSKLRPNRVDLERAMLEMSKEAGTYGILPESPPVLAPAIPRDYDPAAKPGAFKKTDSEVEEEEGDQRDPDGIYDRLRKQTGLTLDEIMDFKVKILVKHNVTNQTRLGKVSSLYCLAIAGNGNGRLGIGQAKGQEAEGTSNLAKLAAIRNMRPIPRYEERTIFGEVEAKVSAVEVKLFSRPPGKFAIHYTYNRV
jgi:small subunit ribosomal protein S5